MNTEAKPLAHPIARYLDAAVLMPEFSQAEAAEAIERCVALNTRTACIRPCDIELAQRLCESSDTGVCVVLGFPHGVTLPASKADEARRYADLGVDEIDMVVNYGWVRSGLWDAIAQDIAGVVQAAQRPVKVIFETAQLDLSVIPRLVDVCCDQGAAFVKTSTGFNGQGATEPFVAAMLEAARGRIEVKPSGGIRNRNQAEHFIRMGATRLGVNWASCEAICSQGDTTPSTPAPDEGY